MHVHSKSLGYYLFGLLVFCFFASILYLKTEALKFHLPTEECFSSA